MRLVYALGFVLAVGGCTRSNGLYIGGGDGGGDDGGCGGCTDGSMQDLIGADLRQNHDLSMPPHDLSGAMCGASGACTTGPECGGTCCGVGERCENGTCHCGSNAACPVGQVCASGGPAMGIGQCGVICCGGAGNPCPL